MQTAGLKEGGHPEDLQLGSKGEGVLREMDTQRVCGGSRKGRKDASPVLRSGGTADMCAWLCQAVNSIVQKLLGVGSGSHLTSVGNCQVRPHTLVFSRSLRSIVTAQDQPGLHSKVCLNAAKPKTNVRTERHCREVLGISKLGRWASVPKQSLCPQLNTISKILGSVIWNGY